MKVDGSYPSGFLSANSLEDNSINDKNIITGIKGQK
jgi:hypothetical protein